MSISIGSVWPCFSKYRSSATMSSVTAGTSCAHRTHFQRGCVLGTAFVLFTLHAHRQSDTDASCKSRVSRLLLVGCAACRAHCFWPVLHTSWPRTTRTHRHAQVHNALIKKEGGQVWWGGLPSCDGIQSR